MPATLDSHTAQAITWLPGKGAAGQKFGRAKVAIAAARS
jgi:hypothetical protein